MNLKPPTDRDILRLIYNLYYNDFNSYTKGSRTTKNFVPIDIAKIAREFKVDEDIIFGRLYYHLNKKYGYKQDDGSLVSFFSRNLGGDNNNSVNFPLLSSVLAELNDDHSRFKLAIIISVASLILASFSIGLTLYEIQSAVPVQTP